MEPQDDPGDSAKPFDISIELTNFTMNLEVRATLSGISISFGSPASSKSTTERCEDFSVNPFCRRIAEL